MPHDPLHSIERLDPELRENVRRTQDMTFSEGALSRKHKLLTAMALDASLGAVDGVFSLARQAQQAGATRPEIMETLRIARYICGVHAVYIAAPALDRLFPEE